MPLSRYLVRNEYGLADPDLYRVADKDDPEALLEGVAMAGLVGVLRQLGDLAEFAAEMFHDLHEEAMATAARGHSLIARVQQLEAEFPSAESTLVSQTTHIPFLYNPGVDWHPSIRMDENLVTQGDMPRFVMDSYEECRGPPRLFLLDKFDVAGAGACLKRYTDPSFFKAESADLITKKSDGPREKRIRKVKRRGPQWRNGGTPEAFPSSSHAKLHQLLLEERIETGANDPERRVKLKKRPLDGFKREDRLKSYMQKFMDTYSSDTKAVREISLDLVPMDFEFNNDSCQSGLEIVEIDTVSPREPLYSDKAAYSSFHIPEVVKSPVNELNEVTDGQTVEIPEANYGADADSFSLFIKDVTGEELAADTGSKSGGSVGEYNVDDVASEIDNYVDALATMESETETDSDYKTKCDQQYLDSMEKMIDSNGSEEKQQKNHFLDHHSVGNSTLSDDGTLLKKDVDGYSCSDNVSNTVEDTTVDGTVQSVIREAQGNIVEEFIVYDDAESMGRNLLFKAEFTELPWISVNAASKKIGKEGMEQTDPDSNRQAVVHSVPNSGYDHLMSVGISPVDEMADASSESSSAVSLGHSRLPEETSSHPQSEQARGGQSNLSRETTNSPVGNPINDLGQPVKATSEGLTLLQKSSVSLFNYPEPVYVSCEENDSTLITEEKSEDQPRLSGVVPDHGLNGQIVGAPDVSLPNQLDFSEKDLQCLGKEANIQRVSMSDDNPELMDPMISVAADTDEIVEPRVSTAASSEDSSAPVVDHADSESPAAEIHYPLEVKPLFFGDSESAIRHEFDSSENVDAHSVDQSNYQKVHEPTDDETNINGDDSSSSDPVLSPSQLHSESGQVPKIPDATVELSDDQIAGAGISTAATIANMEGVFKLASADKVVSGLSLHAVGNHDDCLAMYQYESGPAPIRSSDLVYDADEPVQAEGDTNSIDDISHDKDAAVSSPTISDDSCSEHVPEEEDDFDLNRSVQVLDHAETEGARHNCLKVEYTEAQMQSVSSVPDCSSMWFKESLSVNNVPETCLPKFSQTSLYPFCPEESSTSSVECDQQLEKTNSSRYDMVEDKVHVLDALSNAHTKMQIALDKAVEQRGVEITAESFNAMEGSSQPLEFVEQTLPPEDGGNEMYINPISVSSLSAPLSQPLAADISAQSGDYKVESRFVEEEPSALSVSVPHPRGPLDSEVSAQSADHELQSTWQTMEQPSTDFSSISLVPVGAQAGLKLENSGQTKDLSQASLPLFESFPNPDHNIAGEMPPLPPLPPIQWRLGRNQHPFGTMQGLMQPETSDNAGLGSENSSRAQHLNPFLPFSDLGANFEHAAGYSGGSVQQPTDFVFPLASMSHEDGQQHTLTVDQSQGVHLIPGSQSDIPVPASDTLMGKFSFEPLESGLMTDHSAARPALSEDVLKAETAVPHEQFEPIFPPEEQERAVVDERQLERDVEHKIATTSAQFEPSVEMQYRHQLSHGFVAPEVQGIWSTDVFGARKPEHINGSLQKKIQRPRNPLIDAVVAVDKSKLRKVGEMVKPQDKPETEKREQHLPQLRKVGERVKPQGKPEPEKREQHIPQLRKVGKRVKPQDEVKAEESFQNFPSLRKIGERVKPQDSSSAEDSIPHVLQLRKVGERIKPQDEPKADEEKQSLPPLRGVGKLKSQDGPQADKDWLEQIRNQSFNLKPAATTRPSIQGRQTNLKVAAILEKASMIRQAMAGNDEDDSDGWSDS